MNKKIEKAINKYLKENEQQIIHQSDIHELFFDENIDNLGLLVDINNLDNGAFEAFYESKKIGYYIIVDVEVDFIDEYGDKHHSIMELANKINKLNNKCLSIEDNIYTKNN